MEQPLISSVVEDNQESLSQELREESGSPCDAQNSKDIYESLDYDVCVNTLAQKEEGILGMKLLRWHAKVRWLVVFAIGALTGTLACGLDICIKSLSHFKYTWIQQYLQASMENQAFYIPFFLWGILNVAPTIIAALCGSVFEPVAAGSGIPQIKCYLNGVKVPRIVRIKTLACKVIGVAFSVLGGLAVGKEGPMIHSGAVIAAGISQGKTTSFNYDFGVLKHFRQDREKRDFVSAGAAAGVAAAFGAPAGGVLFALEEGTSFWNQSLTWRVLFCAMMSVFSLNLILSAYEGQPGNLANVGLLNFGKFDDLNYKVFEFIPFLVIAVCGGILGAAFNVVNSKLTVFRMKYIYRPWQKVLEAAVVAFLTSSLAMLMIFTINDCRDIDTEPAGHPVQLWCKEGQESTAAILWMNTPEDSVRSFFHDPKGAYSYATVSVFFVIYFCLACITYGLGVPSGLFIPTLLMGAAFGRLVGMLLSAVFPNQPWTDEGKYALVGAAASLGGVVRMTISLATILMECTGNIMFGLPLMVILMVSKWVGDLVNEGLYDIHIHLMKVPLLAWDPPPLANNITANSVMSSPVVTLKPIETVQNVVSILRNVSHNGFPIIEVDDSISVNYGRLKGLILRSQLIVLLQEKVFIENTEIWAANRVTLDLFRKYYPRFNAIDDIKVSISDMDKTMDLRPIMNPSPYTVSSNATVPRIFTMFRGLGLRHVVVLNNRKLIAGIVTRKDLVRLSH